MPKKLLMRLGEMDSDEESLVGKRASRLSVLAQLSFPIIPGFVITHSAYHDFIAANALDVKVHNLFGSVSDNKKLQKAVQEEVAHAHLSQPLIDAIFSAYLQLCGQLKNPILSITQSATSSPLSVQGEANLLIAIKKIWSESIENQVRDDIAIIVQLSITPDEKGEFRGIDTVTPPIPEKHILRLLSLAKSAKKHFYFPQTLSWVLAKDTLYIEDVRESQQQTISPLTATKIYVTLDSPKQAGEAARGHTDGVGLLRIESLIATSGVHPKKMIEDGNKKLCVDNLIEGVAEIAKRFSPRPVVYRISDFTTSEYRKLLGGKEYESVETNPLLGLRGALRHIHDTEVLHLELEAIKQARNKLGLKNVWLMLPFVRTVEELQEMKTLVASSGLYRSPSFKIWMMVETPSNVILLDKFIEQGIDGVSIAIDSLTTLMLGIDKDNPDVGSRHNKQDESVLWALEHVIKTSHKYKITSSLSTADSVHTPLLRNLIDWGITSVSVGPNAVVAAREHIARLEREKIDNG